MKPALSNARAASPLVEQRPSMREALGAALAQLADTDAPALTAQVLLAHAAGLTRIQVLARPEQRLTAEQQAAFAALVARAATGEPLAYLTGEREFYGLGLWVNRHVLVPRPESELLVDLGKAARPRRVVDVGTGSGCLAVALAVQLPEATVTAVDTAPEALALARRNAERHGVAGRVSVVHSDLLEAWLLADFDLIVANLPYVDSDELRGLAVARHEPWAALDGGPGGLRVIERLLAQAPRCLAPGGRLLLEIGATQGQAALRLARRAFPAAQVSVHPDLAGLDRVVAVQA